ncbi:uncharacterized protein PRCAT00005722001 [Priceomyces carsonii]|uniref:uncharacterized protein n=1 Tax=Priceomyces carsonii TaxID=28549 RepID=UPI002ED8B083|nr:unnamed protein product [Priceomyces carsonii]
MSTQSGITVSKEIITSLSDNGSSPLVIKISDDNTKLILDPEFSHKSINELEERFKAVKEYVSSIYPQPRYVVIPKDSNSNIFISIVPDVAPIRQKMLYASTKNTLTSAISSFDIHKSDILALTDLDELTYENYNQSDNTVNLLTKEEKTLDDINTLQDLTLDNSFKKELVSMSSPQEKLLYNFDEEFQRELTSMLNSSEQAYKFVAFAIDSTKEVIRLVSSNDKVAIESLISEIEKVQPENYPVYILYNYSPKSYAFIYSCPSGSKVKDRMTYAAFKQGLLAHLVKEFGSKDLKVDKSIEVGDPEELEIGELQVSSNSAPSEPSKGRLKFNKPKGPRRR